MPNNSEQLPAQLSQLLSTLRDTQNEKRQNEQKRKSEVTSQRESREQSLTRQMEEAKAYLGRQLTLLGEEAKTIELRSAKTLVAILRNLKQEAAKAFPDLTITVSSYPDPISHRSSEFIILGSDENVSVWISQVDKKVKDKLTLLWHMAPVQRYR